MTEQERTFWQAVYQQALGAVFASPLGPISCEQIESCRLFADDALRALRKSEAVLAVEQRGVPPFATGDVVTLEHGTAEVLHAWWGDTDHVWYMDLMYQGRRLNRVTATSLPMPPKVQP